MTDYADLDRITLDGTDAVLRPVFDPRLCLYSVQLWKNGEMAGVHGLTDNFTYVDEPLQSIDAFLADNGVRAVTAEESVLLYAGLVRAEGGLTWHALQIAVASQQS